MTSHPDSFQTRAELTVGCRTYDYYSLTKAQEQLPGINKLPFSLKVLLENLLRHEDGVSVDKSDIQAMTAWLAHHKSQHEIAYRPARVLMQDFTGVPAVVDLAAMRDAMVELGGDPEKINPLSPVDLVIDHSVQVDQFAKSNAALFNTQKEMERNKERYEFLRWGQTTFDNFSVVPPGTGICHQVNLEYLGQCVWTKDNLAYPDTLVGTDSHTTMINALGILGWGVGGIEAEAAMLGQPISMLIPEVVGFKFEGKLNEGVTATDLVLTVVHQLRTHGVVGKFVEFFGPGLANLALADRATIANMAPEYGATCGFFPIDQETLNYLHLSGRDQETIDRVEAYCRAQGLWFDANNPEPEFTTVLTLDLSTVEPSLAGPKRPQDKVTLSELPKAFSQFVEDSQRDINQDIPLKHGSVVIAAITSCTNTSNPSILMAAGLLAKKAFDKGLTVKPWVKTSLAPGSKVVTEYLNKAGLQTYLDKLGFSLVGYGCTTCIGNSGPLPEAVSKQVDQDDVIIASVLSGNRNFEGRIHPQVKTNWLASPPLVIAYALAGTVNIDLSTEPLGEDNQGNPVYLKDIWPNSTEISAAVAVVSRDMFSREYTDLFTGDDDWRSLPITEGQTYQWRDDSTYVQHPPFFENLSKAIKPIEPIHSAKLLAVFGDSITTDHISPAGAIKSDSPAGEYLKSHGVHPTNFNSYGSRRGNHEVMMRGTFANIRIKNTMTPDKEGGYTIYLPTGETMPIYDAAMKYQADNQPLLIVAGKEYGTGSSRDWAAKGTRLLGVKAVLAESFERIHRSNLIGMGVLPLQLPKKLNLTGEETIDIEINDFLTPQADVPIKITTPDGQIQSHQARLRIDTPTELDYYRHGGILHYVLRHLA